MEKGSTFTCPICGNTDVHSIGMLNGKPYCRRCISFKGEDLECKPSYPKEAPIHLTYELSYEQKALSEKLVENYTRGTDSLVFAVTGSGKTEISIQLISNCLKQGKTVGFAVPRRDVAIELHQRFVKIFKDNSVILVCGGNHDILNGDFIVLTTHQLFRYPKYFDLLIIDEVDAFPFANNDTLINIEKNSVKGNLVWMSATADENFIDSFKKSGGSILTLDVRFHRHKLPVPKVIKTNRVFKYWRLKGKVGQFLKQHKPIFIFVPTIDQCEKVYHFLNLFYKGGNYVHSKRDKREQIINDFRNEQYKYLVTTAVLERGVTVEDLQVIVFNAHHSIYDAGSLIQISGRVGRKIAAPEGEVIYICEHRTKGIEESIFRIQESNKNLQNLF